MLGDSLSRDIRTSVGFRSELAPLKGKTCLVTGATNGIGRATAEALATKGATVIVHGRNAEKGRSTVDDIKAATGNPDVHFVEADFAVLAEVRRLADALNQTLPCLDVLVNNAGLYSGRRVITRDGHELTFAVNHLAPFLLTNLLLDKIKAAAPARIVNVSSDGHRIGKLDLEDLTGGRSYSGMRAHNLSKLANILFTRSLAKRLDAGSVTANALHPGIVHTGFGQNGGMATKVFMGMFRPLQKSPAQGAVTSIFLSSALELEGKSGGYYANCKLAKTSAATVDDALAEWLWRESERLVGLPPAA